MTHCPRCGEYYLHGPRRRKGKRGLWYWCPCGYKQLKLPLDARKEEEMGS